MSTQAELIEKIKKLKAEKNAVILAHCYQNVEIDEVADFVGDSYGLSKQAQSAPQKNILMCGVRFMAETAKILSPEKTVYLSHSDAGCPMAEQLDRWEIWNFCGISADSFTISSMESILPIQSAR